MKNKKQRELLLSYSIATILSILVLFWLACGFHFDLHAPLSPEADVMGMLFAIKTLAHGDWFPFSAVHSNLVGAPFGAYLADYATVDHLNFLWIKLLSIFSQDPVVLFNLYFILSFPLTAISFIYASSKLGMSLPIATALGMIYAFLPYHINRYPHLFLAAYFLLPLMGLIFFWIWSKKPLFFRLDAKLNANQPDGNEANQPGANQQNFRLDLRSWKARFSLGVTVALALSGPYYAFFSCFFLICAGLSATLYRKNRYAFLSALILIATMTVSIAISSLPHSIYNYEHGKNRIAAVRNSWDAEQYALKLTHMIFPLENHRVKYLREVRRNYQSATPKVEGYNEYIGFISLIGFLILFSRLFFALRPQPPGNQQVGKSSLSRGNTVHDKLTLLWINGILLATLGGFAVLVSRLLTTQIRSYNRISVFLALFALFAVGFVIQHFESRRKKTTTWLIAGVILIIGLFDQVPATFRGVQEPLAAEFQSDTAFVQDIERKLPLGSAILQIPFLAYPESPPIHQMNDYSHFRAVLHSNTLRWSYGAVKGRPDADEIAKISQLPLDLARVKSMGYQGIYIDRNAFADRAQALENELTQRLGRPPLVSQNQRLSFFEVESKNP